MLSLLRLIRLPNLLIVALTQGLLYFKILLPAFRPYHIDPELAWHLFVLLAGATIIVTASGYIVNDLHDLPADRINRPNRVPIDKEIPLQIVYWLYAVMTLTGFLASLFLAFRLDKLHLVFLFPLAIGSLYGYSFYLQNRVLAGNFLVAFFCAGVAGIVWLAEWPSLLALQQYDPTQYGRVKTVFLWYMVFAFLTNLYREVVKDLEDMEGDKYAGSQTLPLVFGERPAKAVALATGAVLAFFLLTKSADLYVAFGGVFISFLLLTVLLPLLLSFRWVIAARSKADYHRLSTLIKAVILCGLISLFFINTSV